MKDIEHFVEDPILRSDVAELARASAATRRPNGTYFRVAMLARAWTGQVLALKPPSGDGGYDGFNLKSW
jgi:hypothetical protein